MPTFQPAPKGLFPLPELYPNPTGGTKPPREGLKGIGIPKDAVPVTELTWNFSSMLRMAPPPFGKLIVGISMVVDFDSELSRPERGVEEPGRVPGSTSFLRGEYLFTAAHTPPTLLPFVLKGGKSPSEKRPGKRPEQTAHVLGTC